MMRVDDVLEILAMPLLGIMPESADVLTASNLGCPITLHRPTSAPARGYAEAARRLLGEDIAVTAPGQRRGFMSRLFGEGRRHEPDRLLHPAPLGAAVPASGCRSCWPTSGRGPAAATSSAILQQEILAVIARHLPIDRDKVVVRLDPGETVSTLAIDIEVPQGALAH